ncbi:MAG: helicase [Microbacteriaceae bacterium]|nr:helicase [Microbacteriaceae bacterium]NBS61320.1 helicase [Microbacteriaceae bacterium]
MSEVKLSKEQLALFEYIEKDGQTVFVTGRAGTGKSTLLGYLRDNTGQHVVVCAPTGVAAYNVGGITIHSLFGFPFGVLTASDVARHLGRRAREVLRGIDMLIIDEVSMVSANLMDAIDVALRTARGKPKVPFGGCKIVMFGDPYQLAPVPAKGQELEQLVEMDYKSQWFFDAKVWLAERMEIFELVEIFRQRDPEFKRILNAIRVGEVNEEIVNQINAAGNRFPPHENVIRLATINNIVDAVNANRLEKLDTEERFFESSFATGDASAFNNSLPAERVLHLKIGAQVMFIKNDDQRPVKNSDGVMSWRWVNGTIGKVVAFGEGNQVLVEADGEVHTVGTSTWQKVKYLVEEEFNEATGKFDETIVPEILAEFKQIPLRLAWAVTVHKSQGQTYDEVIVDMGSGAFSSGHTYVALSRVRSLDGLYLTKPIRLKDIQVDQAVVEFMGQAKPPIAEDPLGI